MARGQNRRSSGAKRLNANVMGRSARAAAQYPAQTLSPRIQNRSANPMPILHQGSETLGRRSS